MDMQNVLDKLKQIENPTADQQAAIKSTESMTKGGYTPVAETTNTSATYTEYAPESTLGDIAKLAGVQPLAVVGEPLTEGQSPAQKAAFQKMLDAKKGKDNKKEDEVEEDCDASCDDKETEEVKEADGDSRHDIEKFIDAKRKTKAKSTVKGKFASKNPMGVNTAVIRKQVKPGSMNSIGSKETKGPTNVRVWGPAEIEAKNRKMRLDKINGVTESDDGPMPKYFTKTLSDNAMIKSIEMMKRINPDVTVADVLSIFVPGSHNFTNALEFLKADGMTNQTMDDPELNSAVDKIQAVGVKEAGTVDAIVKGSPNLPKGTNKGYNVEGVEEADVPTIDTPPTGNQEDEESDEETITKYLRSFDNAPERAKKAAVKRDRHGNPMYKMGVFDKEDRQEMRTIEYRTAHYLNDLKDKPDHEEQVQKFAKKFAERNPNFLLNKFLQHAGSKSAKATYVPKGQEYVPGQGLRPIEEDENLSEGPTRKDFQMVADLLKDNPNMDDRKAKAQDYCDKFKAMNPRFNSEKFMKACGVQEAYEFFDKPMDKPVGKSIEEAYDPEHVADIIKKHEDEGHKVELEPFKDEEAGFTVTFKDGKRRHYKYTETGSKVTSLEPDDTYVDPNAPKRGRGRPTKEAVEEPVDELTRMFESHFEKQLPKKAKKVNESVQVTQSISDEGQESINVNAQGNHVDMLKQMMQLAGQSQGYEEYQGQEVPVEEERDPEHANTPEEKYADVPTQLKHQSGGVNGPKHTSSLKADSEDLHNKADLLGIQNKEDLGLEESLQDLYKEYKG